MFPVAISITIGYTNQVYAWAAPPFTFVLTFVIDRVGDDRCNDAREFAVGIRKEGLEAESDRC
jgi:hypothetical protein